MPFETILFDISDRVASITLNRPDKLNSFTAHMHEELREAMQQIRSAPDLRALLITGSGRGFCAGQDLGERATTLDAGSRSALHAREVLQPVDPGLRSCRCR